MTIKLAKNQAPVTKYRYLLPLLQKQIEPRGVWYSFQRPDGSKGPLQPPVYQDGLHAFRHLDTQYLRQCMQPEQRQTLKGFKTKLMSILNKAYFGHTKQLYFLISSSQQQQFARLAVRLLLIDQLKVYLADQHWYDTGSPKPYQVLDLRKQKLTTVRKLLRWKKQYSPGFDGMILSDRVDQLIQGRHQKQKRATAPVLSKDSVASKPYEERTSDATKWRLLFSSQQSGRFTSEQVQQFNRDQDSYRKWSLFIKDVADDRKYPEYNLYLDCKMNAKLVRYLESYDVTVKAYPKETYLSLSGTSFGRKLVRLTDASDLDQNLLLAIAKILLQ